MGQGHHAGARATPSSGMIRMSTDGWSWVGLPGSAALPSSPRSGARARIGRRFASSASHGPPGLPSIDRGQSTTRRRGREGDAARGCTHHPHTHCELADEPFAV